MPGCWMLELVIHPGAPVTLPPGPAAWRVTCGAVEAYLADTDGRHFLAAATERDWLFGSDADGVAVLVTAIGGARLTREDEGDWADAARRLTGCDGSGLAEVAAALLTIRASHIQRQEARDAALRARLNRGDNAANVDPLAAVMSEAMRQLGVSSGPLPAAALGKFADVPAMARACGLRATRTALMPGWERDDRGHLILQARAGTDFAYARWHRGTYSVDPQAYETSAWRLHAPLDQHDPALTATAWAVLRSMRSALPLIIGTSIAAAILGLVVPQVASWLFDRVVPAGDYGLLVAGGAAIVMAAVLAALLNAVREMAFSRVKGEAELGFAAGLYDHVLRLPPGFFRGFSAGDLAQRIGSLETVRSSLARTIFAVATTAIFAAILLLQLLLIDGWMAAAALALISVQILGVAITRSLQATPLAAAAEREGRIAGLTYELLEGIAKLRSAAAEPRMFARWQAAFAGERQAKAQSDRIEAHYSAFSGAWSIMTLALIFAVAGSAVSTGLSPGLFIAFLTTFALFQSNFTQLCEELLRLWSLQPAARRGAAILLAEPEARLGRADPGRITGRIAVSRLSFAYDGTSAPIISDLDFEVEPGEHLAIVGGSGSGKSTIFRLLLGFEQPHTGLITYDGQDLATLDLTRVRAQIGVVLQSSQLFAGTIHENVRGASDADLAECMAAVEAAGLTQDLARFPMGLHTPITEGAGTLSGGQRQRILIARALAGSPRILFFDEATSALDNGTQAIVTATLDRLDATRITIAHRLSTVRNADRIAVLEKGRFVECGKYDTLMALDGAFARLVRRQLLEE